APAARHRGAGCRCPVPRPAQLSPQGSFGLSPIERMAAGLALVGSDWNGYRDTVRDGVDGFRIPPLMPPTPYGIDLADRYALGIDDYDFYIGFTRQLSAVDTAATA